MTSTPLPKLLHQAPSTAPSPSNTRTHLTQPSEGSRKTTRHLAPQQIKQRGLNISGSCPLVKSNHYHATTQWWRLNNGAFSRSSTSMRARSPHSLSRRKLPNKSPQERHLAAGLPIVEALELHENQSWH